MFPTRIPDALYTVYFIYIPHKEARMIAIPRRRSERVNTFVGLLEMKKQEGNSLMYVFKPKEYMSGVLSQIQKHWHEIVVPDGKESEVLPILLHQVEMLRKDA